MAGKRENEKRTDFKVELLVVFALLISLGFPGSFTMIYGERLGTVMEYAAFFMEIFAMLLSSGDSWLDIQIIDLDWKYIMLYVFIAVVFVESMLVSGYPSWQFISCIRLCVTALFTIWLQKEFKFIRMVELIGIAQVLFVGFCMIFILRYPGYAYESGDTFAHALKGLYFTKNSFATELSFGIIIVVFIIRERWRKLENFKGWMVFLFIQIIMMLMCQATGAVICTLLALIPLVLPRSIRLPLGWGYITANIAFLFGTLSFMPYFEWFFEALGKDATLTGRIPLWNRIIDVMMGHQTFTGFGYAMFWRDPDAYKLVQQGFHKWSSLSQITTGAHNVLLELWLNIGLIGIACFFLMVMHAMRNMKEVTEERYIFSSMLVVYYIVTGLTERCLGGTYDYKTLGMFLVLAVCCNRLEDKEKISEKKAELESKTKE